MAWTLGFSRTTTALVGGVGVAVLIGWVFDLTAVKGAGAQATMKVNTALAFVLAAVSLWVGTGSVTRARVSRGLAAAVALVGLASLLEYGTGVSFGIDQLLIADTDSSTLTPGRMSVATALNFVLVGAAMFERTSGVRGRRRAGWYAIPVLVSGWLALIGYSFGEQVLYRVAPYNSMAVHTASMFVLISLAILASEPGIGFVGIAVSDTLGGALARRLVPLLPAAFFALGSLLWAGESAGLYDTQFGLALMVVGSTCIGVIAAGWNASLLHSADLGRRVAEAERRILAGRLAERRFESLLESAPDAMVIVDGPGRIVRVNSQAERIFGYSRHEMVGLAVETLVPDRIRTAHTSHRRAFVRDPKTRPMAPALELVAIRKDGTEIPVEISLSPVETPEGTVTASAIRDVSERKATELRLRAALVEQRTMMREIHHRVKNNLAIISSLLYLESTETGGAEASRLLEARDRVRSMALIHEALYKSPSLARLDFTEYLTTLAELLRHSHAPAGVTLTVVVDVEPAALTIDDAVPCGLVLNELVTNAFKHAFRDRQEGEVRIIWRVADGRHVLSVTDTGTGIPADVDVQAGRTLGLRLIRALAAQLGGTFSLARAESGTEATVSFPVRSATEAG